MVLSLKFGLGCHKRFIKVLLDIKFRQSYGNHILFIKHFDLEGVTTLLVYIDDIIVIKNDPKEKKKKITLIMFCKRVKIKDSNILKYFLGMKLVQSK